MKSNYNPHRYPFPERRRFSQDRETLVLGLEEEVPTPTPMIVVDEEKEELKARINRLWET